MKLNGEDAGQKKKKTKTQTEKKVVQANYAIHFHRIF